MWKPAEPQTGLPLDVFDEFGQLTYPDLQAQPQPATADAVSPEVSEQEEGTSGFVEGESVRVDEETTESVEVFANPDGTRTAFISTGPVRAQDDNGEWAPIDTDLSADETGDFVPENTVAEVTVLETPEVSGDSAVIAEVVAPGSDDVLQVGVEATEFAAGELAELDDAGRDVADDGVWFDAAPQADVVVPEIDDAPLDGVGVEATASGVKTTYVLSSVPGPEGVVETLTLPQGWSVEQPDSSGPIVVRDGSGEQQGVWTGGPLWDAAGSVEELDAWVSLELLDVVDGTARARLVFPQGWLEDPARQWPVFADPVVTVTGTSHVFDAWVSEYNPNRNTRSDYNLWVGTWGTLPGSGAHGQMKSLITFDWEGAGTGVTVNSARLSLVHRRTTDPGNDPNSGLACATPTNVQVVAAAEHWTEDVNWNNRPASGSFGGIYDSTSPLQPRHDRRSHQSCAAPARAEWNVTQMFQYWADPGNVAHNPDGPQGEDGSGFYGIYLTGPSGNQPFNKTVSFYSSEGARDRCPECAPELIVDYEQGAPGVVMGANSSTSSPIEVTATRALDVAVGEWAPTNYRFRFFADSAHAVCPANNWTPSNAPTDHAVTQSGATLVVPQSVIDAHYVTNGGRLVVCVSARNAGSWSAWSLKRFGLDDHLSAAFGFDAQGEFIDGVHTGTGNYSQSWTDVAIPTNGPSLAVTRTLNTDATERSGPFGPGFSFNYDIGLVVVNGGVEVTFADGRVSLFRSSLSGGYVAPPGETMTLERSGESFLVETASEMQYRFVQRDDGSHALDRLVDAHGRGVRLYYDDQNRLEEVRDLDSARFIEFGWDGDRITSASVRDTTFGDVNQRLTWLYSYEGAPARLVKVCAPGRDGETASCDDGVVTSYGWALQGGEPGVPDDDAWRVTSITRPDVETPPGETSQPNLPRRITYHPNAGMRVKSVTDEVGQSTTFAWNRDDDGRIVATIKEPSPKSGQFLVTEHVYSTDFTILSDKRPGQTRATVFSYNDDGLRNGVVDAAGTTSRLAYDEDRQLISVTNGEGEATTYRYDNGNQTHVCDPRNTGEPSDRYCTVTEFGTIDGLVTNAGPNQPSRRTHPDGGVETWTYTVDGDYHGAWRVPGGLLRNHVNVLGLRTEYSYTDRGDLQFVRRYAGDELLSEEGSSYDSARGWVTLTREMADAVNGEPTTTYRYDAWGQVTRTVGPYTETLRVNGRVESDRTQLETLVVYDDRGNVRSQTLQHVGEEATARVTSYVYDNLDREIKMIDPEGGEISRVYDRAGNVTRVTDANGQTIHTTYNNKNQPQKVTALAVVNDPRTPDMPPNNELLSDTRYDSVGRPYIVFATDTLGPKTTTRTETRYDDADRVTRVFIRNFKDPDATTRNRRIVETIYDDDGFIDKVLEGGTLGQAAQRVTHHTYDDSGRLVETRLELDGPDRVTSIEYNYAGQVTVTTITEDTDGNGSIEADETAITKNTYDVAGRLICTQVGNGGADDLFTQFGYHGRGHLLWESTPNGTTNCDDAPTITVRHRYDLAGNRISTTSPPVSLDGSTTMVSPTASFATNAFGETTHVVDERDQMTVTEYDGLGRAVTITHPTYTPPTGGASITPVESFRYDANGNLVEQTSRRGNVTTFEFDSYNRVVWQVDPQVSGQAAAGEWFTSYNVDGTVASTTDPTGAVVQYTYDQADQVVSETRVVRDLTVASPTDGQTISLPGQNVVSTYRYNDLGSVRFMTDGAGNTTEYVYDNAQRQTAVIDPDGDTTRTHYSVHGNVAATITPAGVVHASSFDPAGRSAGTAVHANETAWSAEVALRTTSVVRDANGNVLVSTDADGHMVSSTYDALNRLSSVSQDVTVTDPPPPPPEKLAALVVGNPNALTTGDAALQDHLIDLGFSVSVVNDGAAVPSIDGLELVVITDSSVASQVRKYDVVAVPVIVLEHGAWDDLGLTRANGAAVSGTSVSMTNDTELDADLGGTVKVITGSKLSRATDAHLADEAITVAAHPTGGYSVFAYEAGAVMASADAPARRVGFGVTTAAVSRLNANGWALFDAAVAWATTPVDAPPAESAVLVVGRPASLSTGDTRLRDRLTRLGYVVSVVDDNAAVPAIDDLSLIVVTDTAASSLLNKYKDVAVPMIVAEHGAWDDLGLATVSGGSVNGKNVSIVNDTDLDAGLSGTIKTINGSRMTRVADNALGEDVVSVASHTAGGQTIFAYDQGAAMANGAAPARRVGMGYTNGAAQRLTVHGWFLFDASVRWATTPVQRVALVVANPASLGAADAALRDRLAGSGFDVSVIDDNAAVPAAQDVSLVVITDTSVPANVRKYDTVAVPVMVLEHAAWDDLGLTTAAGRAVNGRNVAISNDTDLDAGLSGTLKTITGSKMTRATDAQLADTVINAVGHSAGGQVVFGYEAGVEMVDGISRARRVGFGAPNGAVTRLNTNGWALFDAAAAWAATPQEAVPVGEAILVVANPNSVGSGDNKLRERLRRRGFDVRVVDDNAAVPDLTGVSLIVISDTSVVSRVRKYESVAVPLIVLEHAAWDDLGLTTANGRAVNGKNLRFDAASALDAGLSGTVQVTSGSKMTRATQTQLGADAIRVAAHTAGGYSVFAYESGSTMADGSAAARRVAFGVSNAAVPRLNVNGRSLLDAAISWAVSPPSGQPLRVALVARDAASLDAPELALQALLASQGHDVTIFSQTDDAPASGVDVAIVAYNANLVGGATIESWRDAGFGVVATRHWDFDDFGLTESGQPEAFETDNAVIAAAAHPVAGGFTGTVEVVTGPWSMRTNPVDELGADVTAIAVEAGHSALYVYDTGDRLVGHTNASPNTAAGRRVAFNLRDNAATRLTADGVSLLTAALYWAADATPPPAGAQAAMLPEEPIGAAAEVDAPLMAAAAGPRVETITFTYGYDRSGNVTRVVDGRNNVWEYTYNSWGLQEDVIEPSTDSHTAGRDRRYRMIYDAGGLPQMEILPGNVIVESTYDVLGRRVRLMSGSLVEETVYDAVGRLVTASHPDGDLVFVYNDNGQLVSSTGAGETTAYDYDVAGRLERRHDAAGVWVQTWADDGRLATVSDPVTGVGITYGYDNDRLNTVSYGGQVGTRTYTYDPSGRLDTDTWVNNTGTVWAVDYGYDGRGNVTSKTVTAPGSDGAGEWTYGYDEASRLTSWGVDGGSNHVGWDGNGNRTSHGFEQATYDARNRIVTSPDGTHEWEPRGTLDRVVGPNGGDYSFDAFGRLVEVTAGAGVTVDVSYDALDRIATRNGDGFGYNGAAIDPVSIGDDTYGRSPGGSLVSTNEAAPTVAVRDRHGDVVATLNVDGSVASTKTYDPFGEQLHTTGTAPALGFQADYTDPVTGDVWMGARWYDPTNATFRSRDTVFGELSTPISLNRYTYGFANPLSYWDPDGRLNRRIGQDEINASSATQAARAQQQAAVGGSSHVQQLTGGPGGETTDTVATANAQAVEEFVRAFDAAVWAPPEQFDSIVDDESIPIEIRWAIAMGRAEMAVALAGACQDCNGHELAQILQIRLDAAAAWMELGGCDHFGDLQQSVQTAAGRCQGPFDARAALEFWLIAPSTLPVLGEVIDGSFCAYDSGKAAFFGGSHADAAFSCGVAAAPGLAMGTARIGANLIETAADALRAAPSPSAQAAGWQGSGAYPGVDDWVDVTLPAGTRVHAGEPGVSGFFASDAAASQVGHNATALNQGLQIAPRNGTYRPGLTEFEITQDVRVAQSIAQANSQFGPGGLEQYFIPDWEDVTEPVVSRIMR